MCGIAGIFRYRSRAPVAAEVVSAMADTMAYRGPDDRGVHCEGAVGLGHRRLSIIDVTGGHQPLGNEDGSCWLVYNGEIYNHRDLRRELESHGHVFRTNSDSEAVLHAYEQYGPQCVERFRGMFAFAVWDRPRRRLFMARDRFGVKPLYYADGNGSLIFGSEIKALLASGEVAPCLREDKIPEQLCLGYLAGDETLLDGIRKLPAGHTMTVDEGGGRIDRYWDLPAGVESSSESSRSPAELCERFSALLEDAVKARLMSDVPLGAFLSGGLDSSAVVALMARHCSGALRTFSVGYDDPAASELRYARLAAQRFGAEHHEVVLSAAQLRDLLPRLIWHEDKPIAFPASVPLYLVARLAREHVKVVLTGEGSDELLGGYDRYAVTWWNLRLGRLYERTMPAAARALLRGAVGRLPQGGVKRKLERTFVALPADLRSLYVANFLGYFRGRELESVLEPELAASLGAQRRYAGTLAFAQDDGRRDLLSAMQYIDVKTYLEELLMKQDRMSMAASVESRVPFLDHRLAEFAWRLPASAKLRGLAGKRVLKQAMRGIVPDEIIDRRKLGFPVPTSKWLRGELAPWCREVLLEGRARAFFKRDRLEAMVAEHVAGRVDHGSRLWQLLNFALWHDAVYAGWRRAQPPRATAPAAGAAR
jgi:asparagine synthase (glutamine-hydrolysing)